MNNQSLFENCSIHYQNEILFENCTLTSAPCLLIQDLNTAISITFNAYYISISLFSATALINLYCLCVTLPLLFETEEELQKRYIFLVTRCLSCIFMVIPMILSTTVMKHFLNSHPSTFILYALMNTVSNTSMFGFLGSYAALALLFYVGVMYPVYFRSLITLRFVYILVLGIYLTSLVISIPIGVFQAAIQSPGVINCSLSTCVPWVNLIEFIIASVCLVFTIAILFFVFISLVRSSRKLKRSNTLSSSASSVKRVRNRLGWSIIAVCLIAAAQIIPYVFLLDVAPHDIETCKGFYKANKFMGEVIAGLCESVVWIFLFILDPIVNIFFDKKVSEKVKQQFRWLREKIPNISSAAALAPL